MLTTFPQPQYISLYGIPRYTKSYAFMNWMWQGVPIKCIVGFSVTPIFIELSLQDATVYFNSTRPITCMRKDNTTIILKIYILSQIIDLNIGWGLGDIGDITCAR